MICWLIFGLLGVFGVAMGVYGPLGGSLLLFILLGLLGWKVFGPVLRS